jgi:hypothetical protein
MAMLNVINGIKPLGANQREEEVRWVLHQARNYPL